MRTGPGVASTLRAGFSWELSFVQVRCGSTGCLGGGGVGGRPGGEWPTNLRTSKGHSTRVPGLAVGVIGLEAGRLLVLRRGGVVSPSPGGSEKNEVDED